MKMPKEWKESLLAEMNKRFDIAESKGRLHNGALAIDDTQLGVEFAMDFIESLLESLLDTAPTPPAQYRYEAACSGLRYTMPEACGNVSAIHIDGKRWPVAMDGWREAMSEALDVVAQYAPGFSLLIERMEKILGATTPPAQEVEPIPMVLRCWSCQAQHIDEGEWETKPHRSHECQSCKHIWRPADVATVGVSAIQTKGRRDSGSVQEDEPVAEPVAELTSYYEPGYGAIRIISGKRSLDIGTKLYTRPNNDRLRKAAEAYVKAYKPGWDHHGTEEYKNLRKALGNPHG